MKFLPFVLKHLRRNWIRTLSTVLAMAVCIFLFCTLRTVLRAMDDAREYGNVTRLVTRHAVSLVYNLIPVLTAVENVELPLLLTSLGRSERRERALTALRVVGLADRSSHYPRQLSGGQEQRVAIARAIVADPVVLVADEPTGDLDAKSAEEILALMESLNRDFGKTIVMVTHDPRAAERAHVQRHLDKGVLKD